MAAKVLNTILYLLLFLLAFLILIRFIRSKEGFENTPTNGETYDVNLFFEKYPIQKACEFFQRAEPKIVQSFSLDESGKPVPDSVAKISAERYIRTQITPGLVSCPFVLPKSKDLKEIYSFVNGLDDKLLAKAMSMLIFIATNSQVTAQNTKKAMEGFITEGFITMCSADELTAKAFVPLQCIPPDVMKASEQQVIDAVDKFDMEQRVSQKGKIAKKLLTLHTNLEAFKKENASIMGRLASDTQKQIAYLKSSYDLIKNVKTDDEEMISKREKLKAEIQKKETELLQYTYAAEFSVMTMPDLVKKCEELEKQNESAIKTVESGIPGAPKS
jgi:hypothetical protein